MLKGGKEIIGEWKEPRKQSAEFANTRPGPRPLAVATELHITRHPFWTTKQILEFLVAYSNCNNKMHISFYGTKIVVCKAWFNLWAFGASILGFKNSI